MDTFPLLSLPPELIFMVVDELAPNDRITLLSSSDTLCQLLGQSYVNDRKLEAVLPFLVNYLGSGDVPTLRLVSKRMNSAVIATASESTYELRQSMHLPFYYCRRGVEDIRELAKIYKEPYLVRMAKNLSLRLTRDDFASGMLHYTEELRASLDPLVAQLGAIEFWLNMGRITFHELMALTTSMLERYGVEIRSFGIRSLGRLVDGNEIGVVSDERIGGNLTALVLDIRAAGQGRNGSALVHSIVSKANLQLKFLSLNATLLTARAARLECPNLKLLEFCDATYERGLIDIIDSDNLEQLVLIFTEAVFRIDVCATLQTWIQKYPVLSKLTLKFAGLTIPYESVILSYDPVNNYSFPLLKYLKLVNIASLPMGVLASIGGLEILDIQLRQSSYFEERSAQVRLGLNGKLEEVGECGRVATTQQNILRMVLKSEGGAGRVWQRLGETALREIIGWKLLADDFVKRVHARVINGRLHYSTNRFRQT